MSTKDRNLLRAGLAALFLLAAVLACGPTPAAQAISVTINSPPTGSIVTVGESVMIDSTATAEAGVDRVELTVNGQMVRRDSPPGGNPTAFRVSQLWTPTTEGRAAISVVAFDVNGQSSGTALIDLQVVAGAAGGATAVPPTAPIPTAPIPTEPPVTTEAGCTLNVTLVSETIPDNTAMAPGEAFVKVWRVRNAGTCDWEGANLFFAEGTQMGGPANVALPGVPVGGETDISMNLVAPASPGTYKGTWRFRTGEGDVFGRLWVLIVVPAPVTDTPLPTSVPTGFPTGAPTNTPEPTVALATVMLPTLPAAPFPYTTQVHNQTTVPPGQNGLATVSCPDDSVLVGGGFMAPAMLLVYTSSPFGNAWRAGVKNTSSSDAILSVYANCLYAVPGASTSQVQSIASISAGSSGNAFASCPSGSVVTGGGWVALPDSNLWIYSSSMTGNSWLARAQNEGGESQNLSAYAVCLSAAGATTSQVMESVPIPGGEGGSAVANCTSSILVGGGFSAHYDLIVRGTARPGSESAWRTYASNPTTSSKVLISCAICLSLP